MFIILHNIITKIKGINAIGHKEDIEIQIDEKFHEENFKEIEKKIKDLKLSFSVNLKNKIIPKEIFKFDSELVNQVNNNTKNIIEQNRGEDLNSDKSYRRKIKRKSVENKI